MAPPNSCSMAAMATFSAVVSSNTRKKPKQMAYKPYLARRGSGFSDVPFERGDSAWCGDKTFTPTQIQSISRRSIVRPAQRTGMNEENQAVGIQKRKMRAGKKTMSRQKTIDNFLRPVN